MPAAAVGAVRIACDFRHGLVEPAIARDASGPVLALVHAQEDVDGAPPIGLGFAQRLFQLVQERLDGPGVGAGGEVELQARRDVAIEIVQQFDWEVPDWIVIPGGNLGNVSALGKGFLMLQELGLIQKLPRICVAQAENNDLTLDTAEIAEAMWVSRADVVKAFAEDEDALFLPPSGIAVARHMLKLWLEGTRP